MVIHTVGPELLQGMQPEVYQKDQLRRCYKESLRLAREYKMFTVVFPAISAGGFHYPPELAAEVACETVREVMSNNANLSCINMIVFCMWKDNMLIYERQMRLTFPAGFHALCLSREHRTSVPAMPAVLATGIGLAAAPLDAATAAAQASLSQASLPGWMPTVSSVMTKDGALSVVHLWDILTWTAMVPGLDRTHDYAADLRRPIRMIDQNITDRIALYNGDLVRLGVDVIVNSANPELTEAHGVSAAIHLAAGPQLLEAWKLVGQCPVGDARITPGFRLPAKAVVHTVGPRIAKNVMPTEAECLQLSDC
jgi:O-acetyl-ADP-ribose deacetylase (regulator of RNase III)